MKRISLLLFIIIIMLAVNARSQYRVIDSLNLKLADARNDTMRLVLTQRLGWEWLNINCDTSLIYLNRYFELSGQLGYNINQADALHLKAFNYIYLANYAIALENLYKALDIADEADKNKKILPAVYLTLLQIPDSQQTYDKYKLNTLAYIHYTFALLYWINEREEQALHIQKFNEIAKQTKDITLMAQYYFWKGQTGIGSSDSAIYYMDQARSLFLKSRNRKLLGPLMEFIGLAYHTQNDHKSELKYLLLGLYYNTINDNIRNSGFSYLKLSGYYSEFQRTDSAIYYARRALAVAEKGNHPDLEVMTFAALVDIFKQLNQKDSSYRYLEFLVAAKDKLTNVESIRQFENVEQNQRLKEKELKAAKERYQNQVKLYGLLAGIGVLIIIAFLLLRNIMQRKKANAILQHQKLEIENQRNKVLEALSELKATQAQLIQSEKMASLGELTAGIAHEIQNPLNFVNNFSEVSKELIGEMNDELAAGNWQSAKEISEDIGRNLEKINHHGKRADAIVKGMLQHSRSSSGQKEPTNINALADEYLRLAYHGLRAKDKSFNASMKTDFDPNLGEHNIIPQDFGRAMLNLITNAFYAVNEKRKMNITGYEPVITVTTKKINDKVEINIADNGIGIPQKVLDKIFQPFFTTKPTGAGTGLGLSLSYDIVTKGHGGELKVKTKEGEGSEFIIVLPQKLTT